MKSLNNIVNFSFLDKLFRRDKKLKDYVCKLDRNFCYLIYIRDINIDEESCYSDLVLLNDENNSVRLRQYGRRGFALSDNNNNFLLRVSKIWCLENLTRNSFILISKTETGTKDRHFHFSTFKHVKELVQLKSNK